MRHSDWYVLLSVHNSSYFFFQFYNILLIIYDIIVMYRYLLYMHLQTNCIIPKTLANNNTEKK